MFSFLGKRFWIYSLLITIIYPIMFGYTISVLLSTMFSGKKTQGRNQESILLKGKTSFWFSREKKARIFLLNMHTTINGFCTDFKVEHLFTFITCNYVSHKWCSSTRKCTILGITKELCTTPAVSTASNISCTKRKC